MFYWLSRIFRINTSSIYRGLLISSHLSLFFSSPLNNRWWPTCVWSRRGWTRVCLCSTKYLMWPTRFRMKLVSRVQSKTLWAVWEEGGRCDLTGVSEVKWKQWWNLLTCQTDKANTSHFLWPSMKFPLISSICAKGSTNIWGDQWSNYQRKREKFFFCFSVWICGREFHTATSLF